MTNYKQYLTPAQCRGGKHRWARLQGKYGFSRPARVRCCRCGTTWTANFIHGTT